MKTHVLSLITFFKKNCANFEIMAKNMLEAEGTQMTSQYGAYELHAG
jgi:hypothetical protein